MLKPSLTLNTESPLHARELVFPPSKRKSPIDALITNLVFLSELVIIISFQVVIVLSKFRNRDWWMVHHG